MTKRISGAKGGGSAHTPVETPDNLRSIAYFRILDLVSEGEIGGLVNGQQSIYLDETPLANADGSSNFPKAHIAANTGTPDQVVIPGFDSTENEISVNVELKSASPWLRSITNPALSAIRLTLGVPALSKANTTNGDITGYTVNYKIELQTDGGAFALVQNGNFTGKTTTKYQRSLRIDLPHATTGWQIKVTRLTANANSSAIQDTTTIDSYTEIVDSALAYPNSALVGCMGDASQFSNIPQRAYDLYGRVIQVPSNYDVTTRAYTGTWDGTFKPSWTDNPAWIFYDICTNTRYGLGHLITAAQVDKWELYRIGQYCDQLVSDGHGGQEPRFTCNIYLQTQADAYKLLNDLSTTFRGISYWANGTIVASADMPADPVYTYTDANVINGQFTYSASARKTRYTSALVSWNDPRNFYRTKVEYVENAAGIARYGFQQATATAVGCTSQGQAQRFGQWLLLTSQLETDTVTFSVGLDGTIAAPGQIIRVADSARAGKRQGGRVHSATTTAVTVDAAPAVAVGDTLTVIMPDGVSQTRTVSAVSGKNITVSVAFTSAPLAESVWAVESTTLAAQTYRVLAVTEDKSDTDISFTITALQHNASKFAAVDTGTAIVVPPISALTTGVQSSPMSVTLSAHAVVGTVATYSVLTISWESAPKAVRYEGEYRRDSGEWIPIGEPDGLSVDIVGVSAGTYTARIRAIAHDGNASLPRTSDPLSVADATSLPTSVAAIDGQAADALAAANAANAAIANIASDNILSAGEKPTVIRDNNVILAEQAGIDAQASAYAITTEKTAYDGKVSALTSYLAGLTTPVLWSNLAGDTTIDGPTFRTRFADVYTTRQALLNAIYAAAKSKADAAQSTANTASSTANNAAATKPVINPQFLDGQNIGWTYDNAAGFYVSSNADTPDSAQPSHLARNGQAGTPTTVARNLGYVAVQVEQTVVANCCLKAFSCNAGSVAQVRISWRDINHAELSTALASVTCGPGGTFLQCVSKAVGQAPAGTQFAHLELYFTNHTSGYFTATSANLGVQPAGLGEVPDSGGRYGVHQVDGNGLAVVDFSQAAHVNKTLNNIGDGGGYVRGIQSSTAETVDNADFEASATTPVPGWTGVDANLAYATSTNAYAGTQSLVVTTTSQYGSAQTARKYPCTAGDVFLVSAAITNVINTGPASCQLNWVDKTGAVISQDGPISTTAGWGIYSKTVTAPANAVSFVISLQNNGAAGSSAWYDKIRLSRVRSLDTEVQDGSTYARPLGSEMTSGVHKLGIAGSGKVLGNQLNAPNSLTLNYGAARNTTALSAASTGAVSVNAFSISMGGATVSYNAVANAVTGLTQNITYQIYCHDPGGTGGTKTWYAATSGLAALQQGDDVVIGGQVTIPPSGTSGGGTGGGGAGGWPCVEESMYLRTGLTAGDLARNWRWWHWVFRPRLQCTDGKRRFVRRRPRIVPAPCVRITAPNGATLDCSIFTPFTLRDGMSVMAPAMENRTIITDDGWFHAQHVQHIGTRNVVRISVGGHSFFAGASAYQRVGSHNAMKP